MSARGCVLASPAFERIARPTLTEDGSRAPALRFGDPRVQALAGALCTSVLAVTGIINKSLRALMTGLLGGANYTMNSVTEGDLEDALLLAADLSFFWFVHSHFGESGAWYDRLLAERARVTPRARVKLLLGGGEFSMNTGDLAQAAHRFEEARRLAQQAKLPQMEGWALYNLLINAAYGMKFDEARRLAVETRQRFEVAGDQLGAYAVIFASSELEMGGEGHLLGADASRGCPAAPRQTRTDARVSSRRR